MDKRLEHYIASIAALALNLLLVANSWAQTASTSNIEDSRVLAHLVHKVSGDLVDLEATIDSCNSQAESRGAIDLRNIAIGGDDASKERLILGVSHLYFDNLFECERSARERLAFSLGTLHLLSSQDVSLPPDIQAVKEGLLYPARGEIEYAIRHQGLPEGLRATLEEPIGKEPFRLMKTLKQNGITRN